MSKQKKPLEKRFTRVSYHHMVIRLSLVCPFGMPSSELKQLSGVRLVSGIFERSPAQVAREVADHHKKLKNTFEASRKAKS